MTQTNLQQEEYIPLKSRVWVSAADAAVAILQSVVGGGALTYYFTRLRGLSPEMASIVWIIFGVWNAVNDPLFGYISDRTKSSLGRRIPYIRYGSPLIAIAFVLFWLDFNSGSQTFLFFQLLVGLFLYDTLYTAIASAIYVMPYEMAVSNKARSSVFIWKIIFQTFSIGLPLVLLPIIQPGPGDNPAPFRWTMCILGVLMGAIVYLSTYYYREKHFQQTEEQYPFFKSIKESFTNFSFIIFLVVSFTVIYVQTGLMQGVLYYFDELKVPSLPIFIAMAAGILLGVFLWVQCRERWGVKKCLLVWLAIFSLGCFIMLAFGRGVTGAAISFLMIGIGFAGGMYLIPIMNGDVIDFDEKRTGLRREGMYAGINSLVTKPAISLAQAAFLTILGRYGYQQNLGKGLQSTIAQTGILAAWMVIPGVLLIISFAVLFWYPLAGKAWEETKQKLSLAHTKKEQAYLKSLGFGASEIGISENAK
jgi:GPH family glycoside/pentoside/hexuronide:cation symporter